ncbi:MAG: hypothetical protein QOF61_3174, partial [Acidobacteriota bacterium]|nr:hypothetical protein [Acidobacteriota bacterium]
MMKPLDIFLNKQDRLRSGWRFCVFAAAYYSLFIAIVVMLRAAIQFAPPPVAARLNRLPGSVLYLAQFFLEFAPALLLGWGCGRL